MLNISSVEVHNWCQHRRRSAKFYPGANGIIGPNGIGKSNFVNAIYTGLTGKSLVGQLKDNIRYDADQAEIVLNLMDGNVPITIRRQIEARYVSAHSRTSVTTSGSIKIGEGKSTHSTSAVNKIIFEVTGLSPQIISDHIFIHQNSLWDLLFAEKQNRLKSFIALVPALVEADRKRMELYKELSSVPEISVADSTLALTNRKLELETRITKLMAEIAELTASRAAIDIEKLTRQLNAHQYVSGMQSERERLSAERAKDKVHLDNLVLESNRVVFSLTTLRDNKNRLRKPEKYVSGITEKDWQTLLELQQETTKDIVIARTTIKLLKAGDTRCQTCGNVFDNPEARLVQAEKVLTELTPLLDEVNAKIAEEKGNEAAAERRQAEYVNELRSAEALYASTEEKAKFLKDAIDSLIKRVDDATVIITNIDKMSTTDLMKEEDVVKANTLLQKAYQVDTEVSGKQAGIDAAANELNSINQQLAEISTLVERAAKVTSYRDLLSKSRELLHPDRLPKQLLTLVLYELCEKVNEYLVYFGSPYTVAIDEGLGIECRFGNGYSCDASRLSGGQKCSLSLSFRFAIHEMFASRCGFVVLDEPTVYLDKDNRGYMAELLSQVHNLGEKRHMQAIIITHDTDILSKFSNIIDMGIPVGD